MISVSFGIGTIGRLDGRTDGLTVGQMDGQTDGRSDGRTVVAIQRYTTLLNTINSILKNHGMVQLTASGLVSRITEKF